MADRDLSREVGQKGPGFSSATQSPLGNEQPGNSSTGQGRVDLKAKVASDAQSLKDTAQDAVSSATAKVEEKASEQKTFIARQIGGLGSALQRASDDMARGDGADLAGIAGRIGSSMESFAKDIEGRDLGDLMAKAEEFGRRQPLAFMGFAALAGLAASRFLTASAPEPDRGYTDRVPQPSPSAAGQTASSQEAVWPSPITATASTKEDNFNG